MKPRLKAVVLHTTCLKKTRAFFETILDMKIEESSVRHFAVSTKGIRILFVQSDDIQKVEFYLTNKATKGLMIKEDPNQIKIIISQ